MDRNSFLSSLPFVLPTCLSSWPQTNVQVLLKDTFFASLEPQSSEPAFFANSEDPAMTSIQLAIHSFRPEEETANNEATRTSLTQPDTLLTLLAKLDGRIYVLDATQLQSFSLVPANDTQPSSWVLQFPALTFRLFSNFAHAQANYAYLQQAHTCLQQHLQQQSRDCWKRGLLHFLQNPTIAPVSPESIKESAEHPSTPHPNSSSGSAPLVHSGSTTTTEGDCPPPQQLQQQPSLDSLNPSPTKENPRKRPAQEQEEPTLRLARRRRWHQEYHDCIAQIAEQLLVPQQQCTNRSTSVTTGEDATTRNLLTATADAQARAYLSFHDQCTLWNHWNQTIQSCTQQLLEVDFFPARRGKAALDRRASSSSLSSAQAIQQAQALLDQRQEAVREKVQLWLLPTRG